MNNDRRDTLNWADEIEDGSFPPLPNFKGAGQEEAAVHKNAARGGNRVNKHPASSMLPMNYAKVIASRNLPRKLTRRDKNLIEKATSPVKEPVEFDRVKFRINSSIFAKYKGKEKFYIARQLLKTIGLGSKRGEKSKYFDLSLIGNSIIELYVPRPEKEAVMAILAGKSLEILNSGVMDLPEHGRTSQETANNHLVTRLSVLYKRANLVRHKECILRGVPAELQALIVAKASAVEEVAGILRENSHHDEQYSDTEMAHIEPEPIGRGSR